MSSPSSELQSRVTRLLGSAPVEWVQARGGYTNAGRWIVSLDDGRTLFVKAAVDQPTAGWLRDEFRIYAHLRHSFLSQVVAWDAGELPLLVLEDLSRAHWPPPWSAGQVRSVLSALRELHASKPPPGLHSLEIYRERFTCWWRVAEDPSLFLALGLCDEAWLRAALPALVRAEAQVVLEGDELLHLDVRSDNICFAGERVVLVDWNWACVGNGIFDVAAWLPSLAMEGGPGPESILPDQPDVAAFISGYWAWSAGQPPIPQAPGVRGIQRRQLEHALPWAARALGLPEPTPASR